MEMPINIIIWSTTVLEILKCPPHMQIGNKWLCHDFIMIIVGNNLHIESKYTKKV